MKNCLIALICTAVMFSLPGCDKRDDSQNVSANAPITVEKPVKDLSEKEENKPVDEKQDPDIPEGPAEGNNGIDVDLSTLSSTLVYAEVYNMMYTPEDYIGKSVKMEGVFEVYHDDFTGKDYFGCIISDATACCSQGIEFELAGDYTYPDDYPALGNTICVEGVFDTYLEEENTYCILRNAKLVSGNS